jgi:hypothetical protein
MEMNLEIPGLKTVCNIKWSLSIYHEAKYRGWNHGLKTCLARCILMTAKSHVSRQAGITHWDLSVVIHILTAHGHTLLP